MLVLESALDLMLQADDRSDAKQTCSTVRIALAEAVCIHRVLIMIFQIVQGF